MPSSFEVVALALALAHASAIGVVARSAGEQEIAATASSERAAPLAGPGLFDADSPLEVEIKAPWRVLRRRKEVGVDAKAVLVYKLSDGTTAELEVRVALRGKWRLENCTSPQLTLRAAGGQAPAGAFLGQRVLHITTQCRPKEKYRQHLLQEFVAYKMYGILTESALRTRLAVLELTDPEAPKSTWQGQALVVEDIGLAAERIGRRWLEDASVRSKALLPEATALFALFQFMIGNTDWSLLRGAPGERCCHNTALLALPESDTGVLPLPFDFDASGLVNTGDVKPSEMLPIRSVRQRFYRGLCIHNPRIADAIGVMNQARPEIETLVDEGAHLAPLFRESTRRYLDEFYEIINDPIDLEKRILANCRG